MHRRDPTVFFRPVFCYNIFKIYAGKEPISRKSTAKELALGGMFTALGVVFLCLGGIVPLALYACPILASAVLLPVRENCRRSVVWSCYAAIAVLGTLLGPDKESALLFVFSVTTRSSSRASTRSTGGRCARGQAPAGHRGSRCGVRVFAVRAAAGGRRHGALIHRSCPPLGHRRPRPRPFLLYDLCLDRLTVLYRRRRK